MTTIDKLVRARLADVGRISWGRASGEPHLRYPAVAAATHAVKEYAADSPGRNPSCKQTCRGQGAQQDPHQPLGRNAVGRISRGDAEA